MKNPLTFQIMRFSSINPKNTILKYWKKSAKTWMCACCQIESKTQFKYSFRGSMVERPHTTGGARVQSQAISLYLNLGSLNHKRKLTGWNLQSRSGTKCFAVYPIWWRHRVNNSVSLRIYSHHTQNCVFSNKYLEINICSFHGSLVERP